MFEADEMKFFVYTVNAVTKPEEPSKITLRRNTSGNFQWSKMMMMIQNLIELPSIVRHS